MEAVAASVEEHCGRWLSFERPSGGFYLWVRLKKGLPSALVNVSPHVHCHSSLRLVAVAGRSLPLLHLACGGVELHYECVGQDACAARGLLLRSGTMYYRCECRARAATAQTLPRTLQQPYRR